MESPQTFGVERRRWARTVFAVVALALAVLVAAVAVVQVRSLLQGIPTTGTRTIDRSGPVLLQSMRDLSRYDAASGTFQVIVDLEKDTPFLPTAVVGQRTLFVAIGSVDAFVDFSHLDSDAIQVSGDRSTVQVRLPHAALDKPNLDHQRSYVFAQESGIVDRVRAFFDQSPNSQAELYQVAEKKIGDAASQSGLKVRAEANTRTMLRDMLRSLGYQQVTVTYA
ncbi:MAG TPA: DUF4230 domain-containing protein [Terriglobales bacterium]|nr:DUF4230 domain-containing protein [Terriglobales bacterium]